jgi:hypothetical protein
MSLFTCSILPSSGSHSSFKTYVRIPKAAFNLVTERIVVDRVSPPQFQNRAMVFLLDVKQQGRRMPR